MNFDKPPHPYVVIQIQYPKLQQISVITAVMQQEGAKARNYSANMHERSLNCRQYAVDTTR